MGGLLARLEGLGRARGLVLLLFAEAFGAFFAVAFGFLRYDRGFRRWLRSRGFRRYDRGGAVGYRYWGFAATASSASHHYSPLSLHLFGLI